MPLTFGSVFSDLVGAPSSAISSITAEAGRLKDTVEAEAGRIGDATQAELGRLKDTLQGGAEDVVDAVQEGAESFVDNAKDILSRVPIIGGLFNGGLSFTDKVIIAIVALSAIGLLTTIITGRRKKKGK